MTNRITIGLFGFGCVGQGLWDVLQSSPGFKAEIKRICVKDRTKTRTLPDSYFTFNKYDILDDPAVNTIVELIDDAVEAYQIVTAALKSGRNVVTANKKMLAEHLPELEELQRKHGVSLLYEAAACGSIPIIRNLEEYYDNELLSSVSGIFNGSSNYILSAMSAGLSYESALQKAQDRGFAESDPTLDVEGYDAAYKLIILAYHSFGLYVDPSSILSFGISAVSDADRIYAAEKGLKIKLLPTVRKNGNELVLYVLPHFLGPAHHLYNVEDEYNGVTVEGAFACTQAFIGKGAGGHPTGSAVLSDISALRYGYRYEYKKRYQESLVSAEDTGLRVYLRFSAKLRVEELGFVEIEDHFRSASYQLVRGTISLQTLARLKGKLLAGGAFVAVLPEAEAVISSTLSEQWEVSA